MQPLHDNTLDTPPLVAAKEPERQLIAQHVDEYLARGGTIEVVQMQERSLEEIKLVAVRTGLKLNAEQYENYRRRMKKVPRKNQFTAKQ